MSFSGKVVLVTGAASGIGAAAAEQFAREGARVALVDRDEAKLADAAHRCEARGANTLVITADLANEQETNAVVGNTIERFQQLDILVNCAGIFKQGSLLDGNILKAYDMVMQVNLRAAIQLSSLAAPHLIKTKGNIVNVSSIASFAISKAPNAAVYCISKAALDHFTRTAAKELGALGVRVNSVNPGPVNSNFYKNAGVVDVLPVLEHLKVQTALNRISEPDDIADIILFLASDKAKNITGSIHVADNGFMIKLISC